MEIRSPACVENEIFTLCGVCCVVLTWCGLVAFTCNFLIMVGIALAHANFCEMLVNRRSGVSRRLFIVV